MCCNGCKRPLQGLSAGSIPATRSAMHRKFAKCLIALALLLPTACGQTLSGGAISTPDPGTTPLPSTIQRAEAIAMVRGLNEQVGRIDRIDAKLMTLEEYVKIAGPVRPRPGDPQATVMPDRWESSVIRRSVTSGRSRWQARSGRICEIRFRGASRFPATQRHIRHTAGGSFSSRPSLAACSRLATPE